MQGGGAWRNLAATALELLARNGYAFACGLPLPCCPVDSGCLLE